MPYTPTRPIMGSDELAAHHLGRHGRDYTFSDDGYDDMELARKEGWRILANWGADGWDLGTWPYVTIQITERGEAFLLQSICEGDHDRYTFESDADRDAAIDYLFLWYAASAGHDWAPLTHHQRDELDAGGFEVDPKFRGPYRTD